MGQLALNRLWCRNILDRLSDAGISEIVICSGGRSAALGAEAFGDARFRAFLRIDERAATFFALGLARASGRAVAVVTTSGSAVVNTLPAISEAWVSGVPLVLISCDRPNSARASGAPQTLPHLPLSASMTAAQVELAEPAPTISAFEAARAAMKEVLVRGLQRNQPVHLNVPLNGETSSIQPDDTLADLSLLAQSSAAAGPAAPPSPSRASRASRRGEIAAWAERAGAKAGLRGVIAVGPHPDLSAADIARLKEATGYALVIDAGSDMRRALPEALDLADILVFHPIVIGFAPQIVLHAGKEMTSPYVETWLRSAGEGRLALDGARMRGLPGQGSCGATEAAFGADDFGILAELLAPGDAAWSSQMLALNAAAQARAPEANAAAGWNEATAVFEALQTQGFDRYFFASSLAVRMGNLWVRAASAAHIDVNRGLNGIDGTLSTFFGTLSAKGERGMLIIGDQAFLHDLPALERFEDPPSGVIFLIDNAGPGLLDLVVWNGQPPVRGVLHRETEMDVAAIARAFGLGYARVGDAGALRQALADAPPDEMTIVHALLPDTGLEEAIGDLARRLLGVAG
ncbi:MAG: 2-succinyl-5-enolpyruvyl-6-hydroxy-3-cyclohexene-1-carboxylic-acid synthase [Pseudomonadota bacterium]